jgi:hypothetical protein
MKLKRINKSDPYCYAKGLLEEFFYEISDKNHLETAIIRSGNIVGPGSIWVIKLFTRLLEKKPIAGFQTEHASNGTFVGNLAFGIAKLLDQDLKLEKNCQIMNFAEFGNISWRQWTEPITTLMNIPFEKWPTDKLGIFKPSLTKDITRGLNIAVKAMIPVLAKGKASSRLISRFVDLGDPQLIKSKTKSYVKDRSFSVSNIDSLEYAMAQIYLNETSMGLENVPEIIANQLPYGFDFAISSILNWARFAGYGNMN